MNTSQHQMNMRLHQYQQRLLPEIQVDMQPFMDTYPTGVNALDPGLLQAGKNYQDHEKQLIDRRESAALLRKMKVRLSLMAITL
jgi:hypothetical protein